MPVGERKDPYRNFRFLLEIDGIVQAGFSEVTRAVNPLNTVRETSQPQ
jgi:hypothetical protein